MSKPTVTLVYGDDWDGLYFQGRLELQGHSIRVTDVLELLGISYEIKSVNSEWLSDRADLPQRLSEVQTID